MEERPRCIICGTPSIFYLRSKDRFFEILEDIFDLRKCPRCGIIFLSPRPAPEILDKHYPAEYGPHGDFDANRPHRIFFGALKEWIKRRTLSCWLGYEGRKRFWQIVFFPCYLRFSRYPKYAKGGRLLDVGCGSGKFLREMQKLGWAEVTGTDVSEAAVDRARQHGLHAHVGTLAAARFEDNYFDAITLHHVFEHVPDPRGTLRELHRILRRGGELVIVVPNTQSLLSRIFGKHWSGLEIPRHLYNYNRTNITRIVRDAGFNVERVISLKIFTTLPADMGYAFPALRVKNRAAARALNRLVGAAEFLIDPFVSFLAMGNELIVRAKKD